MECGEEEKDRGKGREDERQKEREKRDAQVRSRRARRKRAKRRGAGGRRRMERGGREGRREQPLRESIYANDNSEPRGQLKGPAGRYINALLAEQFQLFAIHKEKYQIECPE